MQTKIKVFDCHINSEVFIYESDVVPYVGDDIIYEDRMFRVFHVAHRVSGKSVRFIILTVKEVGKVV